ncbi:type I-E CRISPR-associated endoribonuclease Cas2 [Kitasatospora sp. NPDC059646]|uniref:type I-E CRISPR-associated endoribonuclease Cas2 n=1 Tax=Kitasatospora sp. NPDC059646 TaxID=3346893 RepID=UPI0036A10C70
MTRWLLEVTPQLYIGTISAKVREELWASVSDCIADGVAVLVHTSGSSRVPLTGGVPGRSEIVSRAAGDRFPKTKSLRAGSPDQTAPVDTRRPCPCCGHLVFDLDDGWPGSFAICPVCFWEDDAQQFRWPLMPGGANRVSLVEAQENVQAYGACDQHGCRFVRPPLEDEPVDPAWRPIDLTRDKFEDQDQVGPRPWPDDKSVMCWWLPSFWGPRDQPDPGADRCVVVYDR